MDALGFLAGLVAGNPSDKTMADSTSRMDMTCRGGGSSIGIDITCRGGSATSLAGLNMTSGGGMDLTCRGSSVTALAGMDITNGGGMDLTCRGSSVTSLAGMDITNGGGMDMTCRGGDLDSLTPAMDITCRGGSSTASLAAMDMSNCAAAATSTASSGQDTAGLSLASSNLNWAAGRAGGHGIERSVTSQLTITQCDSATTTAACRGQDEEQAVPVPEDEEYPYGNASFDGGATATVKFRQGRDSDELYFNWIYGYFFCKAFGLKLLILLKVPFLKYQQ